MSREAVCISRRGFLAGSAATGAGFMLAMKIPFSSDAHADDLPPEINAWVVVNDDDSVTIRIARSEMGRGTLTGLAQLVAARQGEGLDAVADGGSRPRVQVLF